MPFSNVEMATSEGGPTSDELLGDSVPQVHSIDVAMSAPTITVSNDLKNEIIGYGLALADVPVEQDRAYWEWRVQMSNSSGDCSNIMFGVSNKRNQKFFEILGEKKHTIIDIASEK